MRDRVSVRAIAIGVLAGLVLSNLAAIIPTTIAMMSMPREGIVRNNTDMSVAMSLLWEQILSSPSLTTSVLVISSAGDFLSGYLAGRLARSNELLHGLLVGLVIMVFNLILILLSTPLRLVFLFSLLALPVTLSGALLARAHRRRATS